MVRWRPPGGHSGGQAQFVARRGADGDEMTRQAHVHVAMGEERVRNKERGEQRLDREDREDRHRKKVGRHGERGAR